MTQYSFALTRPSPEVLLGDMASPPSPADSGGWSMPSDNKWNNHLFPHPSTSLHLPPLSPSDQLENDKDKLFYLNIESDTEERQEKWGGPPSMSSLRFQLFPSHVILMGKKKSVCISNVELDWSRKKKKKKPGVVVNIFSSNLSWPVNISFVGVKETQGIFCV